MAANLVILGLAGAGLLLMGGKKKASANNAYSSAVFAMKNKNPAALLQVANSGALDSGTQAALQDQATRMTQRKNGFSPVATPKISVSPLVDIDNNEFAAKVMALEPTPGILTSWALAYDPVYPDIAKALRAKVNVIQGGTVDIPASPSIQDTIAQALATGNPMLMHQVAATLRAQGYTQQADQLDAAATTIEQGNAATLPIPIPVSIPSAPVPVSYQPGAPSAPSVPTIPVVLTSPGIPMSSSDAPTNPSAPSPKAAQAQQLNTMLSIQGRGKEDQSMVKAFQIANGLTADGKYGIKSALAIASYGIIPAKPFYYNKKTVTKDKQAYTAAMSQLASQDLARADQWIEAGNIANM